MKRIYFLFTLFSLLISRVSAQGTDCLNAIPVSASGCSAAGEYDNSGVVGTLSLPSCFAAGTNNGMWFKFVAATATANVTINGGTLSTPEVSLLEPPVVECVGTFLELECSSTGSSSVTVSNSTLTVGATYYIYVDGQGSSVGTFQVCITSPTTPGNDDACSPYVIPSANNFCSSAGAYTNSGATADNVWSSFIPACWSVTGSDNTVWFEFTAIGPYNTISVTGGASGLQLPQITVITTPDCTGSSWSSNGVTNCAAAASGNTVTMNADNLTAGVTYLIAVDGSIDNVGSFQLCINSYTPTTGPANDLCTNATPLCPNGFYTSTTLDATNTDDINVSQWNCNGVLDNAVWFTYVAQTPVQDVVFDITGVCTADYLQFEVFEFTGSGAQTPCTAPTAFSSVGCDNSIFVTGSAILTIPAANMTAGQTYYVLVDNWPGTSCNFDFSITGNAGADAGVDQTICSSAAAFNQTGLPAGGTWTGPGITNASTGNFDAAALGSGNYTLFYSTGSCVDQKIINVTGVDIVVSNDVTICLGESTDLLGTYSSAPTSANQTFTTTSGSTIPDNNPSGLSSTIAVSGIDPTTVGANPIVSVCLNINHNNDQHLDISLICPGGTSIDLSSDNGAAGNNYTNTCFSPSATALITAGTAPFSGGPYLPEGAFSSLNGCDINGTWTLFVKDDQGGATGTLLDWSITFNDNYTSTYSWSPTTGMTNSTTLGPTVTPVAAGAYTYTLTADNGAGCTNSDQVTVNVIACACTPPSLVLNAPAAVCAGITIDLASTVDATSDSGTLSYYSNATDANAGTNPLASSVVSVSGPYYIRLDNPSDPTCFTVQSVVVTVNPLPVVTASNSGPICSAVGAFTLNETGGDATSWAWTSSGAATITTTMAQAPSVSGAVTGEVFTVTGTDANGCQNTSTTTITINPSPLANDLTPSICEDVLGSGSAAGMDLTTNDPNVSSSSGVTYTWYSNPSLTTLVPDATSETVTNGEVFYVNVSTGLCSDVAMVTYSVTSSITLVDPADAMCESAAGSGNFTGYDLTALNSSIYSGSALTTYTWYQSDMVTPVATPSNVTVSSSTTFWIAVTDGNCSNAIMITFTVISNPVADAPSAVTACDTYMLPAPTTGNYYTLTGGTGIMMNASDAITSNQTLFVYAETGTTPNCTDENSFTITINNTPTADSPVDVAECDTYTLTTLTTGDYYTLTGGTGIMMNASDAVTSNQTLFVYAETGTTPNCTDENSFTITINTTPTADSPANVTSCDAYTLLGLTTGSYFTLTGGTGIMMNASDAITSDQTLFVYAETGTTPNCTDENSFTITINTTPTADAPVDITECDSYMLPGLNSGNYYTMTGGPSGLGAVLNEGDVITTDQTLYVFDETGTTPNCTDENSFTITINTTPTADSPANVTSCDAYTLLGLTTGSYFTLTGGTGIMMNASDAITSDQTLFVYAETGTTPNCTDENSFTITINTTPTPDAPADVAACDSYILPGLSIGNSYYTQTNGGGTMLAAGSTVMSSQPLFVLAATGTTPNCTDENSFTITINTTPTADSPADVASCDTYTLLGLTTGSYYTLTGGTGIMMNASDAITSDQTLFVYAETGTTPNCTDENSFVITINTTPTADNPVDVTECDTYTLPALTLGNDYYSATGGPNGTGNLMLEGDVVNGNQTIYVFSETGTTPNCTDENPLLITINSTPIPDNPSDAVNCDGYILPPLTIGSYFAGTGGTGTNYIFGDTLYQNQLVYVYAETGTTPNCSAENSFQVTVNHTPPAPTAAKDSTYCSSYELAPMTVTGTGGDFTWYTDALLSNQLGVGPTATPNQVNGTSVYYVTETVDGCMGPADAVTIVIEDCEIIVPTAFTPDGDNANDIWEIVGLDDIYKDNQVFVYNRWGGLIYQSEKGKYSVKPWDGTYNGDKMPVASYYFIIDFNNENFQPVKGIVSIVLDK